MQFVIPQFIDIEDKVIGPISVRQFVTLLVGLVLIFLNYELIYRLNNNAWVFAFSAFVVGAIDIVFAFVRVNGRPFHYFMLNFIATIKEPRLRIWSKEVGLTELKREHEPPVPSAVQPVGKTLTASKLATLSLVVDTGGAFHADSAGGAAPEIPLEKNLPTLS